MLKEFWELYSECEQQLKTWYIEVKQANWNTPNDIKLHYPSASILGNNRVVFNIKGNSYRLIIKVNYEVKIVWIRFIGTHSQYDTIDATTI